MISAYVDTSCLTAVALEEDRFAEVVRKLTSFDQIYSSNLLEAELRAVLRRERVPDDPGEFLIRLTWVYPARPLTPEFRRVLEIGYVRGADLWHLACALHVAEDPRAFTFLTLDQRQADIGRRLGFRVR